MAARHFFALGALTAALALGTGGQASAFNQTCLDGEEKQAAIALSEPVVPGLPVLESAGEEVMLIVPSRYLPVPPTQQDPTAISLLVRALWPDFDPACLEIEGLPDFSTEGGHDHGGSALDPDFMADPAGMMLGLMEKIVTLEIRREAPGENEMQLGFHRQRYSIPAGMSEDGSLFLFKEAEGDLRPRGFDGLEGDMLMLPNRPDGRAGIDLDGDSGGQDKDSDSRQSGLQWIICAEIPLTQITRHCEARIAVAGGSASETTGEAIRVDLSFSADLLTEWEALSARTVELVRGFVIRGESTPL